MGVISFQSLTYTIGARTLFDSVSLTLPCDQKMGVMGRNGSGKTTLLRLIQRELTPDSGRVVISRGVRLGIMTQHESYQPTDCVGDWIEQQAKVSSWDVAKWAAPMGLGDAQLNGSFEALSGGVRMRAKCVALLAQQPDFILLDEPTNFLDLPTLVAFVRLLSSYEGGVLLVSHDRTILNQLCTHTLEVAQGQLTLYPGPVDEYVAFQAQQRDIVAATNRNIERKQVQLERFISRFRAKASKASQAQSKIKQLAKLQPITLPQEGRQVRLTFPAMTVTKGTALRMEGLTIGYDGVPLAGPLTWGIERGERVAIVGGNGQGKTTLLKTVAGELPPVGGTLTWGHGAKWGYFAQHVYQALTGDDTILDYLMAHASSDVSLQQLMDTAGGLLFSGDDVLKPLSVLSGGEKARVILARVILDQPTVLLLDEPTNHLDVETVDWLAQGLTAYRGTVLLISHDQRFIQTVATQLCVVDQGRVYPYPGDLDRYIASLTPVLTAPLSIPVKPMSGGETGKQQVASVRRTLLKTIATIEKKITTLSAKKDQLTRFFMTDPLGYSDQKAHELEQITEQLKSLDAQWDEHTNQLMALDASPNA